jgi:hypothetical protein
MPANFKVLGQTSPSATANTDLYTVPSEKEVVVSSLVIANRSTSTAATYRIAIVKSGETLANKHYLGYDIALPASNSATLTIGITMSAGDKILVYASTENLSFSVLGMEVD